MLIDCPCIDSTVGRLFQATMLTVDQMRDHLSTQFGYSPDNIPRSLGGLFDPTVHGRSRYEKCLEKVTNTQSICHPYYSLTPQAFRNKSSSNILFFNSDHPHHHHHPDSSKGAIPSASTQHSSPNSLVAIVALRRTHESASDARVRKRESSSSSDSEKRRRSNESLIEEDEEEGQSASGLVPHDKSTT